ncbi:MAG: NAD(P)-dependent dehydrogenase (short-subunit alcohol dehydrogenase family) [Cyclobacteriaceae bacterium]|jgi:NAD(P)-dependent dehydrogenase (short-subunit alcohol dehydrogenase family)
MITNFSLENKVIFISGASSGIGRACAITCAALGAKVILNGRDTSRLKATKSEMAHSDRHILAPFELTNTKEFKKLIHEIHAKSGQINGYIGSAGISTTLPLRNISADHLDLFFQNNVRSHLLLTKEITRKGVFSDQGGSIIYLTSVMSSVGEKAKSSYSMSKGALMAAAKSLAIELAPRKIRVNTVAPGVVETPMTNEAVYAQNALSQQKILDMHPLGLGKPQDIANLTAFLQSDASRWITGTDIKIDGGYTAH